MGADAARNEVIPTEDVTIQPSERHLVERIIGRLQMATLSEAFFSLISIRQLHRVKESKLYKKAGLTWEQFCREIGHDVRKLDRILLNYNSLGEELLDTVSSFGLSFSSHKTFDSIRMLPSELRPVVEEGMVVFQWEEGEQRIEVGPENNAELQQAINKSRRLLTEMKEKHRKKSNELGEKLKERDSEITDMSKELKVLLSKVEGEQLPEQTEALLGSATTKMIAAMADLKACDLMALLKDPDAASKAYRLVGLVRRLADDLQLRLDGIARYVDNEDGGGEEAV